MHSFSVLGDCFVSEFRWIGVSVEMDVLNRNKLSPFIGLRKSASEERKRGIWILLREENVFIWRIYFHKATRDRWDILDGNFSSCQDIRRRRKLLWMKWGEEGMLLIMNVESATKTWIQVFLRGGPRAKGQVIPEIEIGKEKNNNFFLNF